MLRLTAWHRGKLRSCANQPHRGACEAVLIIYASLRKRETDTRKTSDYTGEVDATVDEPLHLQLAAANTRRAHLRPGFPFIAHAPPWQPSLPRGHCGSGTGRPDPELLESSLNSRDGPARQAVQGGGEENFWDPILGPASRPRHSEDTLPSLTRPRPNPRC